MKIFFLLLTLCFLSTPLFSQTNVERTQNTTIGCFTLGVLNGGGSLVGCDFEFLLKDRLAIQSGIGIVGFGAGLNYHFEPSIRSSFISLQYWHQGVGGSFFQSGIGPNFVYRGKKWLTWQIGFATPLEKGPAYNSRLFDAPVMLTYAIGFYIPFKL